MERDLYKLLQESRPTEDTFKHFSETDKVEWKEIKSNPFLIRKLDRPVSSIRIDESLTTLKDQVYESLRFGEKPKDRGVLPIPYGRELEQEDLGVRHRPPFPQPDSDHELSGLYHRDPVGRFLGKPDPYKRTGLTQRK